MKIKESFFIGAGPGEAQQLAEEAQAEAERMQTAATAAAAAARTNGDEALAQQIELENTIIQQQIEADHASEINAMLADAVTLQDSYNTSLENGCINADNTPTGCCYNGDFSMRRLDCRPPPEWWEAQSRLSPALRQPLPAGCTQANVNRLGAGHACSGNPPGNEDESALDSILIGVTFCISFVLFILFIFGVAMIVFIYFIQ
tara:strand:- start:415 stop:1023 length:609 start_codon:yes stop_codon:yes gene_type:complete